MLLEEQCHEIAGGHRDDPAAGQRGIPLRRRSMYAVISSAIRRADNQFGLVDRDGDGFDMHRVNRKERRREPRRTRTDEQRLARR